LGSNRELWKREVELAWLARIREWNGMRETAFDARIKELKDWRGRMLARVREIIRVADPEIVEEWK